MISWFWFEFAGSDVSQVVPAYIATETVVKNRHKQHRSEVSDLGLCRLMEHPRHVTNIELLLTSIT
jgi:hypothetical protein